MGDGVGRDLIFIRQDQVKTFRAELHVHTVLSPCAEVEMIPPLIVREALENGIQFIAITDHNASENVAAVQKAAQNTGLHVLPGMELQTQEEVHLLCLFDTLEQLSTLQKRVDQCLPNLDNNIEYFGEQFVVDETGDFIRRDPQLRLTSARISIDDAFQTVIEIGGLVIPAHVDRKVFGLITQLGFVPSHLPFEALEISRNITPERARLSYPELSDYTLIQGGDVHRLDEFLGAVELDLNEISILELQRALRSEAGRHIKTEFIVDNLH